MVATTPTASPPDAGTWSPEYSWQALPARCRAREKSMLSMLPGTSELSGQAHRLAGLADFLGDQLVGVFVVASFASLVSTATAWRALHLTILAMPCGRGDRDVHVCRGRQGRSATPSPVAGSMIRCVWPPVATGAPSIQLLAIHRNTLWPNANRSPYRLLRTRLPEHLRRVNSSIRLPKTTDSVHNRSMTNPDGHDLQPVPLRVNYSRLSCLSSSMNCRKRSSRSCRPTADARTRASAKPSGLSEAAVCQRVQRMVDAAVMQIVAVTDPGCSSSPGRP